MPDEILTLKFSVRIMYPLISLALLFSSQIFSGNTEPYGAVKNNLDKPVYTRYVRVYPVSWNDALVLKLELYGCVNS